MTRTALVCAALVLISPTIAAGRTPIVQPPTPPDCCRSCSPDEGRVLYRKGGPDYGYGIQGLAFLRSDGPLRYLRPTGIGSVYVGYNLNPLFGLRATFAGAAFFERSVGAELGEIKSVGYWSLALDARVRLRAPRNRRPWIPWLSAGLGLHVMSGHPKKDPADPEAGDRKPFTLARGGAVRLGVGVDIHFATKRPSRTDLTLVMGLGVQYEAMLTSAVTCGPGGAACAGQNPGGVAHALTFGMTFGAAKHR